MERNKLILLITNKIVELEKEQSAYDLNSKPWIEVDDEIIIMKKNLQNVMNSKCPLIRG